MNQISFKQFRDGAVREYSTVLMKESGLEESLAHEKAQGEFLSSLPTDTKHRVVDIVNTSDGIVGGLWYRDFERDGRRVIFICYLYIEPKFRRKGYGSAALRTLEEDCTTALSR